MKALSANVNSFNLNKSEVFGCTWSSVATKNKIVTDEGEEGFLALLAGNIKRRHKGDNFVIAIAQQYNKNECPHVSLSVVLCFLFTVTKILDGGGAYFCFVSCYEIPPFFFQRTPSSPCVWGGGGLRLSFARRNCSFSYHSE